MEYVHDINQACIEIDRILASGGEFIFITPGHSKILDLAVWMLTGKSAEDQYGNRRQRLMEFISRYFVASKKVTYRPLSIPVIRIYTAFKLRSKSDM